MILLNASGIKKMFLDETLFENVSFSVDSADKIGFIGANGAGKSTLFKIITDNMDYESGEIFKSKNTKIGYLEQYACTDPDKTIMEEMLAAFEDIINIENELEDIRFDIENKNGDISALVKRQTSLQEEFEKQDGFYYKSKIKSTLTGLGFCEEDFSLPVGKLSGGQKTRVSLGKILLSDTNLLLLDEPTNHLDIESVEWLEDFLKSCKCAFIIISHDRYFLDRVTNKTFELDRTRFKVYNGNYSFCLAQKEIDEKTEERAYENTSREIKRLEGIVEQQRRWNRERNIRTAESKMKVIERLEKDLVVPRGEAQSIDFSFKACPGGGQDVLTVTDARMGFGGKELFKNVDFYIKKGEKVFLLGPNGCGKTTLLKIILDMYEPLGGVYKIGANIKIGYYDQIQENLSMDKTVIDELWDEYPLLSQTEIRNALAAFLFRGEDVFKEISSLSGGERARVELVKLMLKSVNFLIMDEPTNHLDIESREALEKALIGYDGTMLMVSHDRYFINKLADRILYLTPDGIQSFSGSYDEFKSRLAAPVKEEASVSTGAVDYKEQKRLEAKKRKTLNDFKKTEEAISKTEEAIADIERRLSDPEIASDYVKIAELSAELDELQEKNDELFALWDRLSAEIEKEGY